MLSCRYSGPGSVQYNRRLASADRIVDLISCGDYQSLPPLPLVPYAVSMSLTIIYRALRDNQRDNTTAYDNLLLCCNALDAMSKRWTSTKRVVQLAKRLLKLLNNPGVMSAHPGNNNPHPRGGCGAGTPAVSATDKSSTIRYGRDNGGSNAEEVLTIPAVSSQTHDAIHSGHAAHSDENSQQSLNGMWSGIDASYFQLDRAMYDLFDDSLPNAFQDPSTWDYIHFAMNENSYAGNNFPFTSNFASPDPECSDENLRANVDSDLRNDFQRHG